MGAMTFMVLAAVAFVAGFVFNWLTPRVTPMLPAAVGNNSVLRSIATGVFILVSLAVAHYVAKAVAGKRAGRALRVA